MNEGITAKAELIMRQKGVSFSEACSILGKRGAANRRLKKDREERRKRYQKQRVDLN